MELSGPKLQIDEEIGMLVNLKKLSINNNKNPVPLAAKNLPNMNNYSVYPR